MTEDNDTALYKSAIAALYGSDHQAQTPETIAAAAARRKQTVSDMRTYLRRIGLKTKLATPMLHITGTKGKGSTAAFCESIFRRAYGLRTGLFTSPHLVHLSERIRINGQPISKDMLGRAYRNLRRQLEQTHETTNSALDDNDVALPVLPGYFRMLTLLAVFVFEHYQPPLDVVIVEVGMGGRYDATNVYNHEDNNVCCGVTLIDYDHMRVLGNTLESIAWEKGGIFLRNKENNATESATAGKDAANQVLQSQRCFTLDTNSKCVLNVLDDIAMSQGYQLHLAGPLHSSVATRDWQLGLAGTHQQHNAQLALALTRALFPTRSVSDKALQNALAATTWPGRCQTLRLADQVNLRLDGAHTPDSIKSGRNWFHGTATCASAMMPRCVLMFYCSHERNPIELLELLQQVPFAEVYFCAPTSVRPSAVPRLQAMDLWKEAGKGDWNSEICDPSKEQSWGDTLARLWDVLDRKRAPDPRTTIHRTSVSQCLEQVKRSDAPTEVFVTGSLYLVGAVLESIGWTETCADGDLTI